MRKRTVIWLAIVLGVFVGVAALAALAGSLLPREHVAHRTIELRAAPERVWALVADLAGAARWRKDVSAIESLPAIANRGRWIETTKHGKVPFELVIQEAPRTQVVRVVDDGLPFGGTWTWRLEPTPGGTRLSITEEGFVRNPIFRLMGRLFFSPTATMDAYLADLARALGD